MATNTGTPETSTDKREGTTPSQQNGIYNRISRKPVRTILNDKRTTRGINRENHSQNKQVLKRSTQRDRTTNQNRSDGYIATSEEEDDIQKCPVCHKNGHTQFECRFSICKECRETGHTRKDCPNFVCNKCNQYGHQTWEHDIPCQECKQYGCYRKSCRKLQKEEKEFPRFENSYEIKRNQQRLERHRLLVTEQTNKECRHCFKKHEIGNCEKRRIEWQNKTFKCGCDQNMVRRRSSGNGTPTSISFKIKHTYHCCGCKTNFERNDLQEIITQEGNTLLYCKNCRYNFAEQLPKGNNQKEEIMVQLLNEGEIRTCKICATPGIRNSMINQDQHFFCNLEEKYAWKAWIDSTHNENMNLETRLHHYCFSNKSAGSFYDLNLTKMIKIINFLRGLTPIEKALEETDNDVYTQYSREEDYEEIILQYLEFTDKEEHDELTKQTIDEF